MGVIKTILGLVILVVILAGGILLTPIYTNYLKPDSQPVAMTHNILRTAKMGFVSDWACGEYSKRNKPTPDYCTAQPAPDTSDSTASGDQ
jgi:hypothetical protein